VYQPTNNATGRQPSRWTGYQCKAIRVANRLLFIFGTFCLALIVAALGRWIAIDNAKQSIIQKNGEVGTGLLDCLIDDCPPRRLAPVERADGVDVCLWGEQFVDADVDQALLLPELQGLSISGAQITAPIIEHIANKPRLDTLAIENCPIDDRATAPLQRLVNIERLSLDRTKISESTVRLLGQLPRLRVLSVQSAQVRRVDISDTRHEYTELERIELNGNPLGGVRIEGLNRLRELEFENSTISEIRLDRLAALNRVWIEGPFEGDGILVEITNCPQLTALRVQGSIRKGSTIDLTGAERLEELHVCCARSRLSVFRGCEGLRVLRSLSIDCETLCGSIGMIDAIGNQRTLRAIELFGRTIDAEALSRLLIGGCVESLDISYCELTGSWLEVLACHHSLKEVRIAKDSIPDLSLDEFESLSFLKRLHISGSHDLKKLQILEELKRILPDTVVE
jgi:hypothetical protein